MNILSKKLHLVKPSLTLEITAKSQSLRAEGKDIISLGAGEPDFDTPENVKQAAYAAIKSGRTKYTPVDGIRELKDAIVKKFSRENVLSYDIDNVSVGCGAKHVIFNLIMALINQNDEVIIPSPYWVSYPDMVSINGGKPVIVKTSPKNNFLLTASDLRKNISSRTKLLILNSPNNPTGSMYSRDNLAEISNVLSNFPGIYVISDDIYEHITYGNSIHVNLANINEEMKERTFVVNGVSKAYSMTGWRIGYVAGKKEVIKAMAKIQSQTTSNPCSISQFASVEALNSDFSNGFIKNNKLIFQERRDLVIKNLSNIKSISFTEPEGAFYLFPNIDKLIGQKTFSGKPIKNSQDFANYILEESLVAIVPGIAFGAENYFRLSYTTSKQNLEEACKRMILACKNLS